VGSRSLVAVLCLLLFAFADAPSWRARRRAGVQHNRRAAELVPIDAWDREPEAPASVDRAAFAAALRQVCGPLPKERAERYTDFILDSASRHEEDPFLLAAIMVRMSRCVPDARTVEGVGLTAIQPRMYLHNVRGRKLAYPVLRGGAWEERLKELAVGFFEESLTSAEANLEWAAALLAMWREQHEAVDARFEGDPHRHYVSHFVWGDRVKSARAEDRIFTDRRRLLKHYGVPLPEKTHLWRGIAWGSPLEAAPRVVSSQPGADREEGLRVHRGVDVEAVFGEPVLAVADGRVSFAGVDLPGHANNAAMSPLQIALVPRRSLGHGGRYVCVTHLDQTDDEAWLRSCYMHLEEVRVRVGQRLARGDVLGTVGRTGMKSSAPHLHLEIKSDKRLYDARDVLVGNLVGEPPPLPKKKRRRSPALL
jgi:murein DD-endopeptidase MepM/ murein hydrolase activator NlpD